MQKTAGRITKIAEMAIILGVAACGNDTSSTNGTGAQFPNAAYSIKVPGPNCDKGIDWQTPEKSPGTTFTCGSTSLTITMTADGQDNFNDVCGTVALIPPDGMPTKYTVSIFMTLSAPTSQYSEVDGYLTYRGGPLGSRGDGVNFALTTKYPYANTANPLQTEWSGGETSGTIFAPAATLSASINGTESDLSVNGKQVSSYAQPVQQSSSIGFGACISDGYAGQATATFSDFQYTLQ